MNILIVPILGLLKAILSLVIYCIVADVVFSWLEFFNLINTSNKFIESIRTTLDKILTPVLEPVRNFLPNMGGLDLSPILVILCLQCLTNMIDMLIIKLM